MSQLEGSQPGGFPPCSQEGQSFCSFQVFNWLYEGHLH
jgi:hypothetical protein